MSKIDRRGLKAQLLVYAIVDKPTTSKGTNYQYIVSSNPTGEFAGAAPNSIASYDGEKWNFIPPKTDGLEVFCIYTQELLRWNGSNWVSEMSFRVPENIPYTFYHTLTQEEIQAKKFEIDFSNYQSTNCKYVALFLNGVLQKKEYPYPDFSINISVSNQSKKATITWSYGFNDLDIREGDIIALQLLGTF